MIVKINYNIGYGRYIACWYEEDKYGTDVTFFGRSKYGYAPGQQAEAGEAG